MTLIESLSAGRKRLVLAARHHEFELFVCASVKSTLNHSLPLLTLHTTNHTKVAKITVTTWTATAT